MSDDGRQEIDRLTLALAESRTQYEALERERLADEARAEETVSAVRGRAEHAERRVAELASALAERTRERDELEERWGAEVEHANRWCRKFRAAESSAARLREALERIAQGRCDMEAQSGKDCRASEPQHDLWCATCVARDALASVPQDAPAPESQPAAKEAMPSAREPVENVSADAKRRDAVVPAGSAPTAAEPAASSPGPGEMSGDADAVLLWRFEVAITEGAKIQAALGWAAHSFEVVEPIRQEILRRLRAAPSQPQPAAAKRGNPLRPENQAACQHAWERHLWEHGKQFCPHCNSIRAAPVEGPTGARIWTREQNRACGDMPLGECAKNSTCDVCPARAVPGPRHSTRNGKCGWGDGACSCLAFRPARQGPGEERGR